jgi:hypothetical protein
LIIDARVFVAAALQAFGKKGSLADNQNIGAIAARCVRTAS